MHNIPFHNNHSNADYFYHTPVQSSINERAKPRAQSYSTRSSFKILTVVITLIQMRISTSSIPKITVVTQDGKWVFGDNRRLWVLRHMERLGKCTTINVNVGYYIPLEKFTSYNGGVSVRVRGSPGGSWYLKRDAPTSRNIAYNQTVSTKQHDLGQMTRRTEFLGNTHNRRPTSSRFYTGNIVQDMMLSGQMNRLNLSSPSMTSHSAMPARASVPFVKSEILSSQTRSIRNQQKRTYAQFGKSALDSKILVAAIDFGTTNSGYAFSFRSDFVIDPMKIVTNQWTTSGGRTVPFKAPTCVLYDQLKRFNSFGFKAEETYARLVTMKQHSDWYFFKHFKMELYEKKDLNKYTQIKDVSSKRMLAITVVSDCIKYLVASLLETCNRETNTIQSTDIHWVLTVPAIWNDGAKQFMRKAAIQAGILSDSLTLALEPEAAFMFCKHVKVQDDSDEEEGASSSTYALCPGSEYILIDAGGGTVDITVHEVKWNGKIKEIYKASGGPWGGTNVDEAFVQFLENIFGQRVMTDFQSHNNGNYLEMMREFELKKALVDPQLREDIKLKIPASLYESYVIVNGTEFSCSDFMKQHFQMKIARDKLVVSSRKFVEMFLPTCNKIVAHVRGLFLHSSLKRIYTIVMVGGFSESRCLQKEISRAFPGKTLVIPTDPGMAVVKGAVIYGHNPKAIASRISRYTYGVNTAQLFVNGVSTISKRVVLNGETYCNDCFDIHVRVGQEVTVDELLLARSYVPLHDCLSTIEIPVYSSVKANLKYTDDVGCKRVGDIKVHFNNPFASGEDNTVSVRFIYGDTELGVEARVVKTGQIVKTSFDFLG